jgi:hypothetical protein
VDDDARAVGQTGVDRGRHRCRRVDHQQVARREVIVEVAEGGVHGLVVAA